MKMKLEKHTLKLKLIRMNGSTRQMWVKRACVAINSVTYVALSLKLSLCERTAKALCECAGSTELSLFASVIRALFTCA